MEHLLPSLISPEAASPCVWVQTSILLKKEAVFSESDIASKLA